MAGVVGSQPSEMERMLAQGGIVGGLIRERDWESTPLGPMGSWPQSLRTALSVCLLSRFPMFVFWGPELVQFYNDDFLPVLGGKHPAGLGQPAQVCWQETWDLVGPMLAGVMGGGDATYLEDLPVTLHRCGFTEECYFTFCYAPIHDESGTVGGIFGTVSETTTRVVGERRLQILGELGDMARTVDSASDVFAQAAEIFARHPVDVPYALLYRLDADGRRAHLAAAAGLKAGSPLSPPTVELQQPAVWPLAAGADHPVEVTRLVPHLTREGFDPPSRALVVPIRQAAAAQPAGFLVIGLNSGRPLDEDYRTFANLAGGHISAAIADATAFAAQRHRTEELAALDRAKTAFFTNVSHEFRTPLSLILGPVEDALASPGEDQAPDDVEVLEVVHRNALRLQKLVEGMLDFSRLEAGRMDIDLQPTDLARFSAVLASQFSFAVEKAGLTMDIDCPPLPGAVPVDRDMWEKIVLNLLSNALKFTFEGTITVRLAAEDGHAVLRVSDTGVGIPPGELPHLFERFHRVPGTRSRSHEGSGIGLALVQELVALHGGQVTVESKEGVGTTVAVRIPAPEQAPVAVEAPREVRRARAFVAEALRWIPDAVPEGLSDPDGNEKTTSFDADTSIVVVDDNADLRDYLRRILGAHWKVDAYESGTVALEAIRVAVPDLVISDVMMPGLDGFGLVEALRNHPATRRVPIIMLSARAGDEAAVEGLIRGADDYLVKPFSSRELLARVRARLNAAAAAEAHTRRLRLLAEAATDIGRSATVDHCLRLVAEAARTILGADEADARLTTGDPQVRPARNGRRAGRLVVPMVAGDARTLGVIEISGPRRSTFDPGDEDIAIQLAQLAVSRIEAMQALGREHRVAVTLQESLLPRRLAECPGLGLAADYRPGSSEAAVGGDWYDTVALPDGSLTLVVGDVVGRGVQAAATMGQLRNALRAFLLQGHGPGAVLEMLNDLVTSLGDTHFSTALVARIDPGLSRLTLASAGHPPPLLVPAAAPPRWLDRPRSVPLGAVADARYPEATVDFAPGDTVLFYTDGLVERRSEPLDVGLDRLWAVAARYPGDAGLLVRSVLDALTTDHRRDDVAVLAVTKEPVAPPEALVVAVPASLASVRPARLRLQGWLAGLDMDPDDRYNFVVAVAEVLANAVEHPIDPDVPVVTLRGEVRPQVDEVVVTVSDRGRWRDTVPPFERGRGLRIIAAFADDHLIERGEEGTTVVVRKRLADRRSTSR